MLDLKISNKNSSVWYGKYTDFKLPENTKIIRIVGINEYIAVETLAIDYLDSYIVESIEESPFDKKPVKSKEQMELETALGTVLNKDPLGKYAGMMLKDIFELHDYYWIEWCLSNMQNKYIRDKIQLIKESGLYD